jgi:hypothetical protein
MLVMNEYDSSGAYLTLKTGLLESDLITTI